MLTARVDDDDADVQQDHPEHSTGKYQKSGA